MALSSTSCSSCNTPNRAGSAFCNNCGSSLTGGGSPSGPTGRIASGQVLKQRYRIIQVVGQGGMGAVYKAEDIQFGNRLVAVKEMRQTGLDPQELKEAADAFKQEAVLLAGLKHPNLPSIYDHFEENGRWYLVMDFIEGETLAEHLNKAKGKVLPVPDVLDIGIQLAKVLAYLHTRPTPIIFRDLKPSNVMLTPEGHVYLIDFGIARFFKPGQAKDTVAYGSKGYSPPEQFGSGQTTPQSDIYNLGVTLHEMLSGNDPSDMDTPFRFAPLPSLGQPALTELAALITRMLDMDAQRRPTSMGVVKQELERIEDQRLHPSVPPTTPVPPTIPTPVIIRAPQNKGVTRRNVIIGLIVVVVLAVIGEVGSHYSSPTTQPPTLTLSNYCGALKTGDYQSAYNELSSAVQSQETESQFASDHNINITDCTVSNVDDTAGTGTISYTASNGASEVDDYTLVNENGTWKINTGKTR